MNGDSRTQTSNFVEFFGRNKRKGSNTLDRTRMNVDEHVALKSALWLMITMARYPEEDYKYLARKFADISMINVDNNCSQLERDSILAFERRNLSNSEKNERKEATCSNER